jgi:hypothetical protein
MQNSSIRACCPYRFVYCPECNSIARTATWQRPATDSLKRKSEIGFRGYEKKPKKIEHHVLKALPEKAYQHPKQKARSATDKPKEKQEARSAFCLALRNFVRSNKLNAGTDENNTQMVVQSAAMENPICAFCGKGSHPTEACCHPDAPLGSCPDGPTKHKVINNQHALLKALKDGKTAKDWKDCVSTNSNRQSSKRRGVKKKKPRTEAGS